MKKEFRLKVLESIRDEINTNDVRWKMNIKYYQTIVVPDLLLSRQKKKGSVGKDEVDRAKKRIPEWEKSIVSNKKFLKIVEEAITNC